jgi:hypothetical protein
LRGVLSGIRAYVFNVGHAGGAVIVATLGRGCRRTVRRLSRAVGVKGFQPGGAVNTYASDCQVPVTDNILAARDLRLVPDGSAQQNY